MISNTQFTEADIRKLVDEYLGSGYSLKDFCLVAEQDEAQMQAWLDQYFTEEPDGDNPFAALNIKEGATPPAAREIPKPLPKKPPVPASQPLFARVTGGDIEIYKEVPPAFLKSLR